MAARLPRAGALACIIWFGCGSDPGRDRLTELTGEGETALDLDIATTPDGFAVAFSSRATTDDVLSLWFARVAIDGAIIAPAVRVAELDSRKLGAFHLVPTSDGFALWYKRRLTQPVRVVAMDSSGVAVESAVTVGNPSSTMAAAWTGAEFGFAFTEVAAGGNLQVMLASVTADLAISGSPIAVSPGAERQDQPALVWLGDREAFLIAWQESGQIYVRTFDAALTPLSPAAPLLLSGATGGSPRVAWGDAGLLATWSIDNGASARLAISSDGTAWTELALPAPPNRLANPLTVAPAVGPAGAIVAMDSDAITALPQISTAFIDLLAIPPHIDSMTRGISNPGSGFDVPRVAAGHGGYGLVFLGNVQGARRVYFTGLASP